MRGCGNGSDYSSGRLTVIVGHFPPSIARRARRRPIVSGVATLLGADGEMLDDATDTGWASIRGETWQVKTAARVARGEKVRVVAIDGMSPRVAPVGGA